jgi:hypothetical protein
MNPLKALTANITDGEKNEETFRSNIVSPLTEANIKTSWEPDVRIIQNFRLVWLDSSIDESDIDESIDTIIKLRQIVNDVKKFTDVDECLDFITDVEDENIFMIVSGVLGQMIVPIIYDTVQIDFFYVFCKYEACDKRWVKKWPKVKGIYSDVTSICRALKHVAYECDQDLFSISFAKLPDETSNQNLDELNQSFMHTQLLKEILLVIDFDDEHINAFLTYCREQFVGNSTALNTVEKLREEYRHYRLIWWYTCDCFLYSMLNRILRMMEVDLIIKMGFFVRDLHKHIAELHSEQYGEQQHSDSFIVYRGQGLSESDFHQLMKTKGGLMSFNNFLSTSLDRDISFTFADSNRHDRALIGVLFEITVNPSVPSTPFANIGNVSYYRGENEILFSMHSVFRIEHVKQIDNNDRLWQVDLTLTSDTDPQLHALTKHIREEIKGSTE